MNSGPARENRKSEEIFRTHIWGILPNLMNCLWFASGDPSGPLKENVLDYTDSLRHYLDEFEEEFRKEHALPPLKERTSADSQ